MHKFRIRFTERDAYKEKEEITLALESVNTRLNDTSTELQLQLATTEEKESQILGKDNEIKNLSDQ